MNHHLSVAVRFLACCQLAGVILPVGASATPAVLTGPILNPDNNHLYYLLDKSTWSSAEAAALTLGGHLATVNDEPELIWIYNHFSTSERDLWIGLRDSDQANNATDPVTRQSEFTWTSGEPVTFTRWNSGEPNNVGGSEYFVNIWRLDGNPYEGLWNDLPDDSGFNTFGVVEVSAVPEPCNTAWLSGAGLALLACFKRNCRSKSVPV